jgi:hypothetical protein
MAKEIGTIGLLGLLLNPLVMLFLLIVGIVVFIFAITIIVVYGLETAIALLILSLFAILVLHFAGAINFEKQPWIIAIPFIFFTVGYFGQHTSLISIGTTPGTSQVTLASQGMLVLQLLVAAMILAVVIAVIVVSIRRRG